MSQLIFVAVFIVFGIVGTLIQKANEAKQRQQFPTAAPPDHRRKVQSEMEMFLRGQNPNPPSRPEVVSDSEFLDPAPRRPQRSPKPQPAREIRQLSDASDRSGQGQRGQKKKQKSRNVSNEKGRSTKPSGDNVRRHVEQHIRHLDTDVDDHVKADIVDSVASHLGVSEMGSDEPVVRGNATAAKIIVALRSPTGVRQAILINEVLSRPRALRK